MRRGITLLLSLVVFYGGGRYIQDYIQFTCASAGLSFVLLATWVALGIGCGLITTICLGNYLIGPTYIEELLTDEMAALDARLSGDTQPEDDFDDLAVLRPPTGAQFAIFFLLFAMGHVVTGNSLGDGFMQRYMHPGLAVIKLRSADPAERRAGLDNLTHSLDLTVTPEMETIVLGALNDPDDGVVGRAAHVAGILRIASTADRLGDIVSERPALAYHSMIALGLLDDERARVVARRIKSLPEAVEEPEALAFMLGLLKEPAIRDLKQIYARAAQNEKARFAAVWALAQLTDSRLLPDLLGALEDSDLAVQCAALEGLVAIKQTASAPPLMKFFEDVKEIDATCPTVILPMQKDEHQRVLLKPRRKMFSIIRALAATDHPDLILWLELNQNRPQHGKTKELMRRLWEKLNKKNDRGDLEGIKRRLKQKQLLEAAASQRDGGRQTENSDATQSTGPATTPSKVDSKGARE